MTPPRSSVPWQLARRTQRMNPSAIREILKVTERPEHHLARRRAALARRPSRSSACARRPARVLRDERRRRRCSTAPSEGYAPLREWVAERCPAHGAQIVPSQVLITTGSQQALDLLGKVLIDAGSRVLVETPTYLGALQAFSLYEPRIRARSPTDEHGLRARARSTPSAAGARLLYALPNFQNPTRPHAVGRAPPRAGASCAQPSACR